MGAAEEFWDRECAAAALAGQHICPRYRMPCWVCQTFVNLHVGLRDVLEGQWAAARATLPLTHDPSFWDFASCIHYLHPELRS